MTDNRNETLKVGQVVAYNLSGEIAKGRIISLKESEEIRRHWQYKKYVIKVELLHAACGHSAGHINTVTKPKNVLVLRTADA